MSHTPGPWRKIGFSVWPHDDNADPIASCDIAGPSVETNFANARLIAAAPDMKALLLEFADWAVNQHSTRNIQEIAHCARLIIAKMENC